MTGRLITVIGPRGVGKSRIVSVFAEACAERSMTVLMAQCVGSASEPLLPIRDALRPVLGTTHRTIRSALRRSAPELLEGVPVIGRFLAGIGRDLSSGPQIGGESSFGLYDILATLVVRLGSQNGLCLIVEDAHVADPDTLSFLTYLLNKSRSCPALTIVTVPAEECENPAIVDYLAEWEEKGGESLTVGPLGRDDVREYLAAVLGERSVDESEVDLMVGFTGGNPLLLGESVRQLDTGTHTNRLVDGPSDIPDRIRRLLERRLRRLDERTHSFVDAAAVTGETSHELAPILHLLGVDDPEGLASLDRACKAGVLTESDEGHIRFTSELLHLVTYGQLRANQRRSLHVRCGEWFEGQQQYSEAAHHYARAEDWRRMVPAAVLAAEAAEHAGLHQTAVQWYRRVQGRMTPAELFPRLASALIVVGEWSEADQLLSALPANDPRTSILRSRLCFARGDVKGAADHASRALENGAADDVGALLCLANIHLYGGDFSTADSYADRALDAARTSGAANDQVRCHIVRGACRLYDGDPTAADRWFRKGLWLLRSVPPDARDVGVYSALLGNQGFVEEIQQRWPEAERSHEEALRLRREVADAVGVLESTLAIGRVALGRGDLPSAEEDLRQALHLAEDLGEELQQAKVIHALGELAARKADTETARTLVDEARTRFAKCGTPYDVAYTDLSLARIVAATRPREAIERLANGRAAVEKKGFALLQRLYPELGPTLAERIHAGLLAYVGGDALGLPWEGWRPDEIRMDELEELPERELWPSGSTSDDTALTLLVAEHLAAAGGIGEPLAFLRALAERSPSIPGLGPSTKRAIEHFITTGTPDDSGSDTNGAPMRSLPVGWSVPTDAVDRRRAWVLELSRTTHTGREALTGAAVMAACASWAVEGASPEVLVEIASQEADAVGPETAVAGAIGLLARGGWEPPEVGISLAPAETVAAVLHCCLAAGGDIVAALRLAVALGGDTDTVAALVGGLLGCRLPLTEIENRLTWLQRVDLPSRDHLGHLAGELARIRLAAHG